MWVLWDPCTIRARNEDAYRSCTRYFLLSMCPERERERERERENYNLYDIGTL